MLERIAALKEIDEILAAMKALAIAEIHRIGAFIDTQRSMLEVIETAFADFLAFYRPVEPRAAVRDVVCLIGAERGFCGDFNLRLVEAADAARATDEIIVGNRLAQRWGDRGAPRAVIDGASVADEVPAVLDRLLERVATLLDGGRPGETVGLVVLYHGREGVESRRLLPVPTPPPPARAAPYAPRLTLAPRQLFRALADEYLYALLHAVYYDSLLAENQQRLEHMDRALRKLDERLDALDRRKNRLRQEAIIEDIEVILLATLA